MKNKHKKVDGMSVNRFTHFAKKYADVINKTLNLNNSKNPPTYWVKIPYKDKFITKVEDKFENGTPEEIAAILLSEFDNTPDELINEMEYLLISWINKYKNNPLDLDSTEIRRHLIYEMF